MDTRFILLWLESPLQSWGYDSKFNRRDTLDFPTKSGVLGLVLCAMGRGGEEREWLSQFAELRQTVLSFKKADSGSLPALRDFQMIGSGYDGSDPWQNLLIPKTAAGGKPKKTNGVKLTHRYYLQDAVFAVLLETPAALAGEVAAALQNPVYDIYFGRKCCVPSEIVYQGTFPDAQSAEEAALKKAAGHDGGRLELGFRVVDGESQDGDAFTLNDVPMQFGKIKKYRDRRVTKIKSEK